MHIPRVAAIHDLSGLGRCSLTVAIPVLSAMGVQVCPMPTAVLSGQTGYGDYAMKAQTGQMDATAAVWVRQQIPFDGIYTGFCVDAAQISLIERFLVEHGRYAKPSMVLVDPVLGDNGQRYPVFDQQMVDAVRKLLCRASLVTPNLTEACLLTDTAPRAGMDDQCIWMLAKQLSAMGPPCVVISGVGRGEQICNFAYCADADKRIIVSNCRYGGRWSGTGDLLASVLCGGLLQGLALEAAMTMACSLIEYAVIDACHNKLDPNNGVPFENHLSRLCRNIPVGIH